MDINELKNKTNSEDLIKRKESFQINPSTNMMSVLSHSGYTFDTAIADIIDNSISAKAKNVLIYFDISSKEPFLYILDDGEGMDNVKIHQCLIPAFEDSLKERNSDDLGRYSLGLKSASASFCHRLFVCSKTKDSICSIVEMDFDHIKNNSIWEAFNIDEEDFELSKKIKNQGTLVLWKNLDFKNKEKISSDNIYSLFDNLQASLSHIFGRYILENDINIYVQSSNSSNKIKINGWDPFILPNNKSTQMIRNESIMFNNQKIFIKSYILPTYSSLNYEDQKYVTGKGLTDQEGFYIYRNKRLIQEGGWLNIDGLTIDHKCAMARIEVNIGTSLDTEFDVNFNKSKISIPLELKDKFREIAVEARTRSKNNYDYIKNPQIKKKIKARDQVQVWKLYKTPEGIKIRINEEHPLIKEILKKISKRDSNTLVRLLSNSIPISNLQSQSNIGTDEYDLPTIKRLIKEFFDEHIKNNEEPKMIIKEMCHIQPFSDFIGEVLKFEEEYSKKIEGDNGDKQR